MDVVWLNRFKLNRFETDLSASVNGASDTQLGLTHTIYKWQLEPYACKFVQTITKFAAQEVHCVYAHCTLSIL